MAVAATAPLIWGLYTDRLEDAGWIALTAECICWIELKGVFQDRIKLLIGGTLLGVIFGIVGTASGSIIWLSVLLAAGVGFITSIMKTMGDRGTGLALCVYALFIFCNAFPATTPHELRERVVLILIGAVWNTVAAIISSAFTPAQEPYRRSVAIIWKSISDLTLTLSKGWEGKGPRSNEHLIYLKEKEIRKALDASLDLFEKTAQESAEKDGHEYKLAHARKASALVGAQMITISQELSNISINSLDSNIRLKIFTILRASQQLQERLAAYTISKDAGEVLILRSRISRLYKLIALLKDTLAQSADADNKYIHRFIQLIERNTRITQSAFNNMHDIVNEGSLVRPYSFIKTFYILHPKYWWKYLRLLLDLNTFTTKYAFRTAVATAVGMFAYKYFDIDHGYWIPFTLLIVMQTYFGATIKKARDRILGTLTGGLVAGLFLKLPTGIYLQEALLFLSFIPMIIYLRIKYSWAVFFMTINLVLLFNINREMSDNLILIRALSTISGAGLAIVAGFALLPVWDKKELPKHLADAIYRNYLYFLGTFFPDETDFNWTKNKRLAESGNSNVFDSFTRYMQEPSFRKRPYAIFYFIITHNIRITRELNNIKIDQDNSESVTDEDVIQRQNNCVKDCLEWFNANVQLLQQLNPELKTTIYSNEQLPQPDCPYTEQQEIYLEKMLIELKSMNKDLTVLAEKLPRIMRL